MTFASLTDHAGFEWRIGLETDEREQNKWMEVCCADDGALH